MRNVFSTWVSARVWKPIHTTCCRPLRKVGADLSECSASTRRAFVEEWPKQIQILLSGAAIGAREHLMSIIAGPENFMTCDFDHGFAFGWVTQNTATDRPWLRHHFLAAGGATLVQQRAFTPLHGALVA